MVHPTNSPHLQEAQNFAESGQSANRTAGQPPEGTLTPEQVNALVQDFESRNQSITQTQQQLGSAQEEAQEGILGTAQNNPFSTISSLLNAVALTVGAGPLGAVVGVQGLLGTHVANKEAAANEAAGLATTLSDLRQERGERLMRLMVAHPELLTEETAAGFRSIVDPLVLGDYLGLGFGVNPAMFSRMKNNSSLLTNFLPKIIESFDQLDTAGRIAALEIIADSGTVQLTPERIKAIAVNESQTSDQWRDTFDQYTVGQGMVYAQGLGLDPTEGLNDPRVRFFMAQQQVELGTGVPPSDKLKQLTLTTWQKLHNWQLENPKEFLDLRDTPEKMFDAAGMTGAEFVLLADQYGPLTDGYTDAEMTEVVGQAYIKAMSLVSTLIAIDADIAKDFEDPAKVFAFVDASVRQMMDGFNAAREETEIEFLRRTADEISEASGGTISVDQALTAAQVQWDERVRSDQEE